MSPFASWILSLMLLVQPNAPWKEQYPTIANAIAIVGQDSKPLFSGDKGLEKTAAVLVSLAWFESRFDIHATGDHGRSHGLYQQQGRGELADPLEATRVAIETIRQSQKVCSNLGTLEMLGWYAAGGEGCRGLRESRHRMNKAMWLMRIAGWRAEQ